MEPHPDLSPWIGGINKPFNASPSSWFDLCCVPGLNLAKAQKRETSTVTATFGNRWNLAPASWPAVTRTSSSAPVPDGLPFHAVLALFHPSAWLAIVRCMAQMRLTWLKLHPVNSALCWMLRLAARSATMRWWAVASGVRSVFYQRPLRAVRLGVAVRGVFPSRHQPTARPVSAATPARIARLF